MAKSYTFLVQKFYYVIGKFLHYWFYYINLLILAIVTLSAVAVLVYVFSCQLEYITASNMSSANNLTLYVITVILNVHVYIAYTCVTYRLASSFIFLVAGGLRVGAPASVEHSKTAVAIDLLPVGLFTPRPLCPSWRRERESVRGMKKEGERGGE